VTVVKAELKSAAQQQLSLWNESGPHVLRTTYTPTAGLSWCVVGCVMADAFDPDGHEAALVAGIVALANVTAVAQPRLYGETPATIEVNPEPPEDPTHEVVLHTSSALSCTMGPVTDRRSKYRPVKPPVAKQWMVLNLVLTGPLDTAGIAALEAAIEAIQIGGQQAVTQCEHLIGDTVPADATGISLAIESRIRIDRIPVEE